MIPALALLLLAADLAFILDVFAAMTDFFDLPTHHPFFTISHIVPPTHQTRQPANPPNPPTHQTHQPTKPTAPMEHTQTDTADPCSPLFNPLAPDTDHQAYTHWLAILVPIEQRVQAMNTHKLTIEQEHQAWKHAIERFHNWIARITLNNAAMWDQLWTHNLIANMYPQECQLATHATREPPSVAADTQQETERTNSLATMPASTVESTIRCVKCGSAEVSIASTQTRRCDEAPTVSCQCHACGKLSIIR
jgi:DNA-directed RNA polymerase subunit M/transcription elongation factor TFIIS